MASSWSLGNSVENSDATQEKQSESSISSDNEQDIGSEQDNGLGDHQPYSINISLLEWEAQLRFQSIECRVYIFICW